MPPLPRVLSRMATVCWRDEVVVLGGPYGKFTHDFTYEIFICEIVMWNGNNSYMKISYVKSISHMKVSHMKFSYVKSLCGIGTIHI